MAGGLMSLASCTTETRESDMSQAQIDSTVNARVEEIRVEMMRQNDSLINAMAQIKADSIIAAMKGGKAVTTKTTTTRTTTVKPASVTTHSTSTATSASQPANTGKNTGEQGTNTGKKGDQNQGTNTGKK